jgi:hypothetical protein
VKGYRKLRAVLVVLVVLHTTIGFALGVSRQQDAYPLFSWFLFTHVPDTRAECTVRLLRIDGRRLAPPPLYRDAKGIVRQPHSIEVRTLANRMCQAQNPEDLAAARRSLESVWLPPNTRYEIVREVFDPLERRRGGAVHTEPIAVLQSGSP